MLVAYRTLPTGVNGTCNTSHGGRAAAAKAAALPKAAAPPKATVDAGKRKMAGLFMI